MLSVRVGQEDRTGDVVYVKRIDLDTLGYTACMCSWDRKRKEGEKEKEYGDTLKLNINGNG